MTKLRSAAAFTVAGVAVCVVFLMMRWGGLPTTAFDATGFLGALSGAVFVPALFAGLIAVRDRDKEQAGRYNWPRVAFWFFWMALLVNGVQVLLVRG